MSYDGIVSRHFNRRLSKPLARILRRTPLTPNTVTSFNLALAFAVAGMIALGWNIAGGIGIQLASVSDGIDGELARLKSMSTRFGAVFDAVSDRYADAMMLGGMTVYALRFEDLPRAEVVGVLALAGALTVSFSRARIEASLGAVSQNDALFGWASRDVRSLIAAIGTVMGQCYWTLIALATLSCLTVFWRIVYLRARNIGTHPET
jgi:phosphatidylglycerophosphate synthase